MLRDLLNDVPLAVIVLCVLVLVTAAVVGAVWAVRRLVPATRDGFHAEVSAPMLGVVAAVFGLLLAFVIVIAYENYLEARAHASREADALASIVRDSEAFPGPGGAGVRAAIGTYVRSVAEDEWPAMREGTDSDASRGRLDGVFAALRAVEPRTVTERAFYEDAVRQLNDTLEARRERIEAARGGLPRELTLLLLFSSLVIVGYAVLVGSPSAGFHVLGPLAIALVVAVSLIVLADLSYPFSGDVSVSPEPYRSGALAQFW
jgi:hypothetical protein